MNRNTILLTTTVTVGPKNYLFQTDKQERINTYIKSIRQWLSKTNFNIVIVENSGYMFEELTDELSKYKDRFEIITFDEKIVAPDKQQLSKGDSELYSINYAFNMSNRLKRATFIIKITGRYYIPNFEEYILNSNIHDYDCLRQNNPKRCEIVGTHIKNFNVIFHKDLLNKNGNYNGHVEDIYKERISKYNKIFVCKVLDIEPTLRGGVDEIFTHL